VIIRFPDLLQNDTNVFSYRNHPLTACPIESAVIWGGGGGGGGGAGGGRGGARGGGRGGGGGGRGAMFYARTVLDILKLWTYGT
jgi:hypothetical protein